MRLTEERLGRALHHSLRALAADEMVAVGMSAGLQDLPPPALDVECLPGKRQNESETAQSGIDRMSRYPRPVPAGELLHVPHTPRPSRRAFSLVQPASAPPRYSNAGCMGRSEEVR